MRALASCVVLIAACNGDHYGAYLHVTSTKTMDQIEFVFGGYMPSDNCDGSVTQHAPILRKTPGFVNVPPADGDTMFRRQPSPGDIRKVSGTDYTLYVDTPINDPTTPFDDTLGHTLIVVAQSGPETLVGELDNFTISNTEVDKYEIPVVTVDANHLEQWGGGDERCLRYTRQLPDMTTASEFIVPTWDRDCDGFFTQVCYTSDGNPIDNDCDPLAFCDVTQADDAACSVPDGCALPVAGTATDCRLAQCQNLPGQPSKVCTNPSPFCLADEACNPQACERPLPACLATELGFDVTCKVSAIKTDSQGKFDEGIVCTNQPPGLLHMAADNPTCTVVEQDGLSNTRSLGVVFSTPSEPNGCDLAVANASVGIPGRISEAGLIVNVTSVAGVGTLLVDVQPDFVNSCVDGHPPSCDDVTAMPHVCKQ